MSTMLMPQKISADILPKPASTVADHFSTSLKYDYKSYLISLGTGSVTASIHLISRFC